MNLNESDLPKNRKRNSGRLNEAEEAIPFTNLYKPSVRPREDLEESNKPAPTCQNNLRCYFCDFCDNTSIHGFKFLGERQRYVVEKIWWFIVVSLAVIGSTTLIHNTYTKWSNSPVIVTFATTETPIWKIPFPAVTICPELKVNKAHFNYSDVLSKIVYFENITQEERDYFLFFNMICDDLDLELEDYFNFNDTADSINLFDFALTYLEAFAVMDVNDCKWMGSKRNCASLLSRTFTSEGSCVTFNKLDESEIYTSAEEYYNKKKTDKNRTAKKWSLEEGYPSNADLDTYPLRTILSGSRTGFQIDVSVSEEDMDYGCGELQGFKVTLHHPAEEPDMDKHFRVPLDEAVFVSVKPRMMTSADDIASYSPQKRQCYLPGEKTLTAYKIYTQQNCMLECLTNYTRKACGCVAFYMADFELNEYCTLKSKHCLENAKVSFLQNDINLTLTNLEDNKEIFEQCDCLPSCTSIEFEYETSQTKYDWAKTFKSVVKGEEGEKFIEGKHLSKLVVYYKDMQFMTSERHELYGTVDFLANCGGLLGLFCGFSFTSSMEILYYLTLRLVCNLKKFGQRVWSGAPELM